MSRKGSKLGGHGDEGGGGGGHGGGGGMRWLLTYADMLTLLFALFIVMYGLSKLETSGKLRQLEKELKNKFSKQYDIKYVIPELSNEIEPVKKIDDLEDVKNESSIDDLMVVAKDLYHVLEKKGLAKLVQMRVTERGLVISLLTDKLLFDLGSAELRPESTGILDTIADTLRNDKHDIRIEGHTCDLPLLLRSRYKNNWELSTVRAANVAEYLVKVRSIDPLRISLIGYGEYRPLFTNSSEKNRMKNRRVDIILAKKTKVSPPMVYKVAPVVDEGKVR